MPRAVVNIPLTKGIDQTLDERLRTPDQLAIATNGYYRRNNALTKRFGFTALAGGASTTDGRGLFSTGQELCVRGSKQLYAYNEQFGNTVAAWRAKGDVSPFTGVERSIFTDSLSVMSSACSAIDGYAFHACSTYRYTDPANPGAGVTTTLAYRSEIDNKGSEVGANIALATGGDIAGVRSCPARRATGGNAVWFGETRPGTNTLNLWRWLTATPTADPVPTIAHADMYTVGSDYNVARYDMCQLSGGLWGYAYIRRGPNRIYVATYNDNAIVTSWLIAHPMALDWYYVAITDSPTSSDLYVYGVDSANGSYLFKYNRSTGALTWARAMHSSSGPVVGCSVKEGTFEAATSVVCLTNTATAAGMANSASYNIEASSTDTGGVALNSVAITRNAHATTRPWMVSDRCYFAGRVRYGTTAAPVQPNYDNAYGSEVVFDLLAGNAPGVTPRWPSIVGRYNFGVAPTESFTTSVTQEWDMLAGSLPTVQQLDYETTKWRYPTRRVVTQVPYKLAVFAGDEVVLDFAGKVTASTTSRGAAVIGGGNVCWYTGSRVEELGWASTPVFAAFTATGAGALGRLPDGTYQYLAVFEAWDEKGNLVRSGPSIPISATTGGGGGSNHWIETQWYTLGPTDRYDATNRFSIALYRNSPDGAAPDGVFRRCKQHVDQAYDRRTNNWFQVIRDNGEAYDVLYTQGGAELDAAGPDGASFCVVTSKRVWLAGFFRADRIQYSKLYTPSTATQYAIAPEFNDAFSFLLPGGEQCVGLAELDDKVIVFTTSNIYAIAGNGPDDGGRNDDFSGLQLVAGDTGCVDARSIVSTPRGVFFQAPSGMFVLGRDLALDFIGAAVRDITDVYTEVTSAVLVPAANHVRFTLRQGGESSTVLIYDFDQTAWIRWEPQKLSGASPVPLNILGACLHRGVYHVLDSSGTVYYEDTSTHLDAGSIYVPMTIETGWLQGAQQSGWQRVRQVAALCKSNDPHALTIALYQDFSATPSQSYTWSATDIASMKLNELVAMRVSQQKGTAWKLRVTDASTTGTVTGQGYECAGFTVELAGKSGLYKPGTQQRN